MSDSNIHGIGITIMVAIILIAAALLGGMAIGSDGEQTRMQRQAIDAGHARYVVDGRGKVTFEWLPAPTEKLK